MDELWQRDKRRYIPKVHSSDDTAAGRMSYEMRRLRRERKLTVPVASARFLNVPPSVPTGIQLL